MPWVIGFWCVVPVEYFEDPGTGMEQRLLVRTEEHHNPQAVGEIGIPGEVGTWPVPGGLSKALDVAQMGDLSGEQEILDQVVPVLVHVGVDLVGEEDGGLTGHVHADVSAHLARIFHQKERQNLFNPL